MSSAVTQGVDGEGRANKVDKCLERDQSREKESDMKEIVYRGLRLKDTGLFLRATYHLAGTDSMTPKMSDCQSHALS